jgi:hypothetical protein
VYLSNVRKISDVNVIVKVSSDIPFETCSAISHGISTSGGQGPVGNGESLWHYLLNNYRILPRLILRRTVAWFLWICFGNRTVGDSIVRSRDLTGYVGDLARGLYTRLWVEA